jgi:hypothetical protein
VEEEEVEEEAEEVEEVSFQDKVAETEAEVFEI